jgi:predicted GTPase
VLIFVNHPEDLAENYRRYVDNKLREGLDIQGVPLRIIYRRREH